MGILLTLMLVWGLYGAHQWWQTGDNARAAAFDASTFAVEMPGGVQCNTVLVLAPPNCPSEEAQRNEALIRDLDRGGTPVVRDSRFAFDVEAPRTDTAHRPRRSGVQARHTGGVRQRIGEVESKCGADNCGVSGEWWATMMAAASSLEVNLEQLAP